MVTVFSGNQSLAWQCANAVSLPIGTVVRYLLERWSQNYCCILTLGYKMQLPAETIPHVLHFNWLSERSTKAHQSSIGGETCFLSGENEVGQVFPTQFVLNGGTKMNILGTHY